MSDWVLADACKRCHRSAPAEQLRSAGRVVTAEILRQEGYTMGWRCGWCDHLNVVGHDPAAYRKKFGRGEKMPDRFGGLKRSYQRTTQLRSADGYVHYGMLKRLHERGYEVPRGFTGDSDALARTMGVGHDELASMWKTTEEDLRQRGEFSLSD